MWRIWVKLPNTTMESNNYWWLFIFYRDTLECNQWKLYMQNALMKHSKKWSIRKNQKVFGQTRAPSLKVNSKIFVKRRRFIYIQSITKPSRHLLRGKFAKTLFTNTWRKIGLGLIVKNFPSLRKNHKQLC